MCICIMQVATSINTFCLFAPNTTGNSPTSKTDLHRTCAPQVPAEEKLAELEKCKLQIGERVLEVKLDKSDSGKNRGISCSHALDSGYPVVESSFCLRYLAQNEALDLWILQHPQVFGFTSFFFWGVLDSWMRILGFKETINIYRNRIQRILEWSSQTKTAKFIARPWSRSRSEGARKGLQLLAAQGGDFSVSESSFAFSVSVDISYLVLGVSFSSMLCR